MVADRLQSRCGVLLTALIAVTFEVATSFLDPRPRLVYNASASAPLGFYWINFTAPERGDAVLLARAAELEVLFADHRILSARARLLKSVAALADDEICRSGPLISINGRPAAEALMHDAEGRSLPRWQGCRRLASGELFLLQPHFNSFDSRYFGPVLASQVIGVAHPVWTWWRE
jgi:conjugative transfer signal peptidase TraF